MSFALEELSLPALFHRSEGALQSAQNSSPPAADKLDELLRDAVACIQRAAQLVDSLGIFSTNEDKDDIATGSLKYLLVPHIHAELLAEGRGADREGTRLAVVQQASALQRSFLTALMQRDVLSGFALRSAEATLAPTPDSNGEEKFGDRNGPLDAGSLRELKIERFKLEKSIKSRLALLERTRSGRANSGVIYHTASHRQHDGDTNDEHEAEEVDEEEADEREFWLLRLESASLRAVDAIAHLQKEAGVLRAANAMSNEQRYAVREATATAQGEVLEQLRAAVGALKTNGGPAAGLWNRTSDMGLSMSSAMAASGAQVRERLRAQVFAPSHALPSMTVEEFGQQEMRQMMLREREAKERQQRAREGKAVAGKDAVEEAEVLKARERDDWKDDNPRGWGNSALRNTR